MSRPDASEPFKTDGMLADVPSDRAARRARFAALFDNCEGLTREAVRMAHYLGRFQYPEHEVVAVAMWLRCISACQGAILLAERGMPAEAAAVLRSGVEHMFWGCALLKRPDVHDWLRDIEREEKRKQAAQMSQHKIVRQNTSEEHRRYLKTRASEASQPTKGVQEVAIIAGMAHLFDTAYRGLSLMGVHAGLTSTAFSIHGKRLALAPTDEQLGTVLMTLHTCLSAGCRQFGPFAEGLSARVSPPAPGQPSVAGPDDIVPAH